MNNYRHNSDGTTILILANNLEVKIDTEDFERVRPYHWYAYSNNGGKFYHVRASARRADNSRTKVYLKSFLSGFPSVSPEFREKGKGLDLTKKNLILQTSKKALDISVFPNTWVTRTKVKRPKNKTRTEENSQSLDGDITLVPLTQGAFAKINTCNFDKVKNFNWSLRKTGNTSYAITNSYSNGKRELLYMHRVILGNPEGLIDHINRDGLDNRESNLRRCTRQQNARNSTLPKNSKSGAKGVSWNSAKGYWECHLTINGKKLHLGVFTSKEDAISARISKEVEVDSEFFRGTK